MIFFLQLTLFILVMATVVGLVAFFIHLGERNTELGELATCSKSSLSVRKMKFGYGIYRKRSFLVSDPSYYFITWVPTEAQLAPRIAQLLAVVHRKAEIWDVDITLNKAVRNHTATPQGVDDAQKGIA